MSESLYKEAAMALTDFLSLSLKHLGTYMPQDRSKKKLGELSRRIKEAESTDDIVNLKSEYRRVILDAESSASQENNKPDVQIDVVGQTKTASVKEKRGGIELASSLPHEGRVSAEAELSLMDSSELLDRMSVLVSRILKSFGDKSPDPNTGQSIDSLLERLPQIRHLGELEEFEKKAHEMIHKKTFTQDKLTELYQEVFVTMMDAILFWVGKNTIIERRIQKAKDSKNSASDPWILKDLASGIKNFFFSKRQEVFVLSKEREKLKSIIISLVNVIQDIVEKNNSFTKRVGECADALDKSENIKDFEKIKSKIALDAGNLGKTRDNFEGEIREIKKKLLSARSSIRSMEEELEKAKEESLRDPLTGVYSRAFFEDKLEEARKEKLKNRGQLGLIFCDIDRFTSVNMRFGRKVGDAMLKALANDIMEELPQDNCLARYADNCFAMILPNMENIVFQETAKKLRDTIRNHDFYLKSEKISVTASVAAMVFAPEDTLGSAVNRLKNTLSGLKSRGGDRCAFAPLEIPGDQKPDNKKLEN